MALKPFQVEAIEQLTAAAEEIAAAVATPESRVALPCTCGSLRTVANVNDMCVTCQARDAAFKLKSAMQRILVQARRR